MKIFIGLIAFYVVSVTAFLAAKAAEMAPPACLSSEAAIKEWVETTIHDAPPVGGEIKMLKHWPLKYTDNENVGKIWIIAAVCSVSFEGKSDHELVFLVYHCESQKGEIQMIFAIPDDQLDKYLKAQPAGYYQVFTLPEHPIIAFTLPEHPVRA